MACWMILMFIREGRHQELHQTHIKKSKAAILKVVSAIQSFTNSWRVFDPVKRQKLRTIEAASKKAKLATSQGMLVRIQEQSDLAFTLLVKSQIQ